MDYKKKYKEALERAKKLYEQGTITESLGYVFPELKESEDERIRRAIIEFFELQDDNTTYSLVPKKDILAWLEKQGENKPTDKVEPKFHEGNWIVGNDGIFKITHYEEEYGYELTDTTGYVAHFVSPDYVESNFHLWTIEDAEDGDVLCYHVSSTTFFLIGIFKRVAHKDELWGGTYRNYAQYGGYGSIENYTLQVALGNDELHHCGSIACPTTKEQRDLLFSKMKEAGYEWDADKKELKKIEPKKLDADKVIEWLNENVANFWVSPCNPQNIINQFKKDFGL